jgi:hypothetical protein
MPILTGNATVPLPVPATPPRVGIAYVDRNDGQYGDAIAEFDGLNATDTWTRGVLGPTPGTTLTTTVPEYRLSGNGTIPVQVSPILRGGATIPVPTGTLVGGLAYQPRVVMLDLTGSKIAAFPPALRNIQHRPPRPAHHRSPVAGQPFNRNRRISGR